MFWANVSMYVDVLICRMCFIMLLFPTLETLSKSVLIISSVPLFAKVYNQSFDEKKAIFFLGTQKMGSKFWNYWQRSNQCVIIDKLTLRIYNFTIAIEKYSEGILLKIFLNFDTHTPSLHIHKMLTINSTQVLSLTHSYHSLYAGSVSSCCYSLF